MYNYRLSCFAQTKTLASKDETFASCLNKAGYWVSLTSFLNTILMQAWPTVLRGAIATSAQFQPLIDEDAVKLAMEFFTYRFLWGAAVLGADIQKDAWLKKRRTPKTKATRWDSAAVLLLQSSCRVSIDCAPCSHVPKLAGGSAERAVESQGPL